MQDKSIISIIVAIDEKTMAIGKENQLLYRIPEDMRRFKKITTGHPIIMGSKTYKSIGKPLPNRTNIVITKTPKKTSSVLHATSIQEALNIANTKEGHNEIFIIGGGTIYQQTIHLADRLYLTLIKGNDVHGDVFFPKYHHISWNEVFKETHFEENPPFSWVTLERKT
jgi:dihydrofolate reductase